MATTTTTATTTMTVSQTLSDIFNKLPPETLGLRRMPRSVVSNNTNNNNNNNNNNREPKATQKKDEPTNNINNDSHSSFPEMKRIKLEKEEDLFGASSSSSSPSLSSLSVSLKLLTHSEVVRLVSQFLDPMELHQWSLCCKATRQSCSLALKLDHVFSYFSILKRCADWIQESNIITSTSTSMTMTIKDKEEGKKEERGGGNKEGNSDDKSGDDKGDGPGGGCDWNFVYKILLQASHELHQRSYGPYKVHPLHAAIIGEILCIHLALRGRTSLNHNNTTTTLDDIWNNVHPAGTANMEHYSLHQSFIMGNYNDYFQDFDGIDGLQRCIKKGRVHKILHEFPSGPAQMFLQNEKRVPYINIFCREDESHSDQIGFYFPCNNNNNINEDEDDISNDESNGNSIKGENGDDNNNNDNKNKGNDDYDNVPYEIFVMNVQELPEAFDDEYGPWYQSLHGYSNEEENIDNDDDNDDDNGEQQQQRPQQQQQSCLLAKAFCKYVPLHLGAEWDEWTQFLRAAWLKAHDIYPFNTATSSPHEGKARWDRLVESVKTNHPEWYNYNDNNDDANNDNILQHHINGKTEVLDFSKPLNDETKQFSKSYAKIYLQMHHERARGSDYV